MSRLDETAKGVFVISVTPFRDDGGLDLGSTDGLVEFYLMRRASGITILGMMGEAQKLDWHEARTFSRHVVRRTRGRVPVVVGVSSPGFASMRTLAIAVMDDGAAGVMVAPPPSVHTDDAVLSYFQSVAEALGDIPFVLQDYPYSTGVHMTPQVIARIIRSVATCVMLKHEDWPGLNKISELRDARLAREMRRISILAGNGGLFLPEELRRGADGAMTGFAFPEMMVDVVDAHTAGDEGSASDRFDAYLPLARYEQQPGIGLAVRKYVLWKRGAIGNATLRPPRLSLRERDISDIEWLLARQERRLASLAR